MFLERVIKIDLWILDTIFQKIVDFWIDVTGRSFAAFLILVFSAWLVTDIYYFVFLMKDIASAILIGLTLGMLYSVLERIVRETKKNRVTRTMNFYRGPLFSLVRVVSFFVYGFTTKEFLQFVPNALFLSLLYFIACSPKPPLLKKHKLPNALPEAT